MAKAPYLCPPLERKAQLFNPLVVKALLKKTSEKNEEKIKKSFGEMKKSL